MPEIDVLLLVSASPSSSLNLSTSSVKEEEEGGKVWTPDRRLWRITFCSLVLFSRSKEGGGSGLGLPTRN